jgi:DNA-binding transcriptional regulator YiaG
MKTYPLHPSPLTLMRTKYRLSQEEAAVRLGLSLPYLRVLEMQSRRIPEATLEVMDLLLGPPAVYRQTTIWEALEELARLDAQGAPAETDGARHA